jgi:hypothetical protein
MGAVCQGESQPPFCRMHFLDLLALKSVFADRSLQHEPAVGTEFYVGPKALVGAGFVIYGLISGR